MKLLSLFVAGAAAFASMPTCEDCPEMFNGSTTCAHPAEISIPISGLGEAKSPIYAHCEYVKTAYEAECCNTDLSDTSFYPYKLSGGDIFADAGSHLSHAETFSGTKIFALITASECVDAHYEHNWQHDPRHPEGKFCAVGAMDGLQALPVKADGTFQTYDWSQDYMRTYVNTEITSAPNSDRTPTWYISTNPDKGGFGQPPPNDDEKLQMWGAIEFFVDYDRKTLKAVNGGHAIKKVYTANKVPFNVPFDATLKADEIFGIVTEHKYLHNNVQPTCSETDYGTCPDGPDGRYTPDCSSTSGARSCGLNGHCGSKLCMKHEYSYDADTDNGLPAYAKAGNGVGFEDDVLLIAEEGHPLASWSADEAITGTVQALDVRTGNLYQLPHVSVGVIEMAFSVSTGHPDYIAVVIEEYGVSEYMGEVAGSRWGMWVGKKDQSSDNFLERNGLAPNSGRLYAFVADSGETDMATLVNWPISGKPETAPTEHTGSWKPLDGMFDGDYKKWNAGIVNTLKATDGTSPVKMSGRAKQEWGSVNPDYPYQWAIAETGLGGTSEHCQNKTADCELGTSSSTLVFLEADMETAFPGAITGATTARNTAHMMPDAITGKVFHVMADQVYHGPNRVGKKGLAAVDSVLWLKGGKVVASEDSSAPGGFNMGVYYDPATRKSVPIVGAIGREDEKMNAAAMAPYGSFSGTTNQEMTGFYDASPALTTPVPYTPQDIYNHQDAKHLIVNNQMKGSAGPIREGFYYTAQTHMLILPEIDFNTYPTSPTELDEVAEESFTGMYGQFRRRKLSEGEAGPCASCYADGECDWHAGHEDGSGDCY